MSLSRQFTMFDSRRDSADTKTKRERTVSLSMSRAQHGHSLTLMMRDYAKWLPDGDRGRNRNRIDASLGFATGAPPDPGSKRLTDWSN
jgi:hypothetical protein